MKKKHGVLSDVKIRDLKKLEKNSQKFWKGVKKIGNHSFCDEVTKSLERIKIPDSVQEIEEEAFINFSKLKEIKFPKHLEMQGWEIAKKCQFLERIEIPDGVEKVEKSAFEMHLKLKEVKLNNTMEEIREDLFRGCKFLERIEIPKNIKKIGDGAFKNCSNLEKIEIPEGVETIGVYAFSNCDSLKEATIPHSVKKIDNCIFQNCSSLEKVEINEGVEEIKWNAFENCENLKEITIPSSVKIIGYNAFSNCSKLEKVEINEGVEKIAESVFSDCRNLKEITIPNSVKEIKAEAFWGCKSLKEIKLPSNIKKVESSAFDADIAKYLGIDRNGDVFISAEPNEKYEKIFELNSIFKTIPNVDIGFIIENKKNIDNVINRVNDLRKMGITIPGKLLKGSNDFNDFLFNKDYSIIKNLIKMMPEETRENNLEELFKLASVMGVMEDRSVTIRTNGKDIPVRDVAYTVLQGAFNRGDIKFDELHLRFQSLRLGGYNEEFLKFMSNKTNLSELKTVDSKGEGICSRIYNWFENRKSIIIPNNDMNLPQEEDKRYKMAKYETVESGVDKMKWKAPTIQLFMEEFKNEKFVGVTNENKHIADYLEGFDGYEQKHFEKAVDIDKERKQSGVKDHITNEVIKEDIVSSLEDYKKRTSNVRNEIVDELGDVSKKQTDIMSNIFTYEMLAKSDVANFSMGFLTSCCATLYGAGAGAQRAMILHEDMQPLVIRDYEENIVAFGIVYVNKKEGYAVVNDFEVNKKYQGNEEARKEIYTKAMQGVNAFVTGYNKENKNNSINMVTCGISPNWDTINDYIKENPKSEILKAPDLGQFKYAGSGSWSGDWHKEQYVIWEKDSKNR